MKNNPIVPLVILSLCVIFFSNSCKKDPPKVVPTLNTSVSNITSTTASATANIESDGGSEITSRGFCWNVTPDPTTINQKTSNGNGVGIFTASITGLIPGTVYYLRSYAINSVGTGYGNTVIVTTPAQNPTITTSQLTSLTATTATSGGNILNDGGAPISARGVCWDITQNPTTLNGKTSDGTGTGFFTSSITGLNPGTIYYFRSYATNSTGTSYGNQIIGTTHAILPTVTTTAVSNVTESSATSGGAVTYDGGSAVTARGVCWSTAQNPTINDSKTNNGTGTSSFVSNITSLAPRTVYYIRAYATNSMGTAYGNQIVFTTISTEIKFEKNVLIEQYTGTWCGYCTRAIAQIENLYSLNKKIVHIALHLSDQMTFSLNSTLFSSFGFTGVPTIHTDRISTWSGNVNTISDIQNPADAGLAINVTGIGTSVNVTVQVKFGRNFPSGVKLSLYMLEDGIVGNQSNYYNTDSSNPFYGKGNPIPNFIHNNVLIKIGTDMFGDIIPIADVGVNKVYSRSFTFSNLSNVNFSKLKVAAFLTHNGGSQQKQVINAVVAFVGENKGFIQLSQ